MANSDRNGFLIYAEFEVGKLKTRAACRIVPQAPSFSFPDPWNGFADIEPLVADALFDDHMDGNRVAGCLKKWTLDVLHVASSRRFKLMSKKKKYTHHFRIPT